MIDSEGLNMLRFVAHKVDELDASFTNGRKASHYIDIAVPKEGAVVISGNQEGLVHIARMILSLAAEASLGAHHHFDASGMVDRCDRDVIVVLKQAPWDG